MDAVLDKCDLKRENLNFKCPRKIIDRIACEIVGECHPVGRSLDVAEDKLKSIRHNSSFTPEDQAVAVLNAWADVHGSGATCLKLAEALYHRKKTSVVELLCDEINQMKRDTPASGPSTDTLSLQSADNQCQQEVPTMTVDNVTQVMNNVKGYMFEVLRQLDISHLVIDEIQWRYSTEREKNEAYAKYYVYCHPDASWEHLTEGLYCRNELSAARESKSFMSTDPSLTVNNVTCVMNKVDLKQRQEVLKSIIGYGHIINDIERKYLTDMEREVVYVDVYINCYPSSSWEHLGRKLYYHQQAAAVEEVKLFLPCRDHTITTDKLMELVESLDLKDVDDLGCALKLPQSEIDKIQKKIENPTLRKEAYLDLYVLRHPCPTWKEFTTILYIWFSHKQAYFAEDTYIEGYPRKHQEMVFTSSVQSTSFDLPPPAKRICTDLHSQSSSVPGNFPHSHQISINQPPISVVAEFLRSQYKSRKLPMYGKWPPTPSKQFINMAVILKEKVSRASADKFTKATIRGNPCDEILKTKQRIDFKHLAETKDGELAQLILVDGAPGIGKSTFAWEACKRWGAGEILQQYKLLLLLKLREKGVQQAQSVADLFYFKCDVRIKQNAIQEIESDNGAGLFLILEGFDELPAHLRNEESLFMDIIKGERLWNATIMLTSRHWASRPLLKNDELHRPLSQHIEILGFTQNNIDDYLQCMTFDDPSLLPGINKYLSCYPHIAGMMYVPLNCAIVLEVYRVNRSNENQLIPKTMTQLYSSLVRTLLLRYLLDHPDYKDKYVKLESFQDLPDSVYEQFCEMAKIAYEGICNDEQIIFSDLPDDFETLGLMRFVPELYVDQGAVVSYNFLHLTLQEFMAAVHVSFMTPDMQVDHFLTLEDSSLLLVFTAGLTRLNYDEKELEKFKRFSSDGDVYETSLFHWLFEAQNAELLCGLCKSISFSNDESDIGRRGPFDYFVLGYCVLQSNCRWDIIFTEITNEETEMFVKGTTFTNNEDKCGKIKSLSLHFEHCVIPQSLTNIPTCLFSELTTLELSCAIDGWNSVFELLLHTPLLHELNLHRCAFPQESVVQLSKIKEPVDGKDDYKLYPEDYQALCMLLSTSLSLTKLMVIGTLQPDTISKYLIDGLNESICLEHLDISRSELSPKDVELLSSMLKTDHTLNSFNIECCDIGSIGACHIADGLNCNRTLKKLIMSFNSIGDDGAMVLAQMLRINMSLTVLDISNCSITELGVSHIAEALCINSSLETIDLDDNPLKDQGAIALAQMLIRNKSLKELRLQSCLITQYGITCFTDALKTNHSITKITLWGNSVDRSFLLNDKRVAFDRCFSSLTE